jgi:hypothetical protein
LLSQDSDAFTLKKLCNFSSDIVVAKVAEKNSYFSSDRKYIYTIVRLIIENNLKGNLHYNEEINLTVCGGTINDITVYFVGDPNFNVGNSSIFFFTEKEKDNKKTLFITGHSQGKFDIVEDKDNIKKIDRNDYCFILVEENAENFIDFKNNVIKLDDFIYKIKKYL